MAAILGAAKALIGTLDGGGMPFFDNQAVIVIEFFTAPYIAQRVNKDASVFFPCFAIGRACMVDPARVAPISIAVDQAAVLQAEEKCVVRIVGIGTATLDRFFRADALPFVLRDAGSGRNFTGRKNALAVYP